MVGEGAPGMDAECQRVAAHRSQVGQDRKGIVIDLPKNGARRFTPGGFFGLRIERSRPERVILSCQKANRSVQ